MFSLCLFLLPDSWNVNIKAGTLAAILGHQVNLNMKVGS